MIKTSIEKIYIKNFRNLEESTIDFSTEINCIFGKNGNGKTNILEAIYYLVYRKSFRKKASFSQILNKNGDNSDIIIKSLFGKADQKKQYSLKVNEHESVFFEGAKREKRRPEVHPIIINPFDSFLFYSKASERRDWFDHALSSTDKEYKVALRNYTKALRMRNTLLAKYYGPQKSFVMQINAIDHQLAKSSKLLVEKRKVFCEKISPKLEENFKRIFNYPYRLTLEYVSQCINYTEAEIFKFYNEKLEEDRLIRRTRTGVHLDDYLLKIEGEPLAEFGSVGQQKVSYLSLLFSYVEYLEDMVDLSPILLIDDISGELDSVCWKNLLKYLETKKLQVFITTANDSFRDELSKLNNAYKITVNDGEIRELPQ